MTFDHNLLVLVLALLLDRIVGDPDALWMRMPHPVALFGNAISRVDRMFNRTELHKRVRRRNGVWSIAGLLILSAAAGFVLHRFFSLFGLIGILLEVVCVAVFMVSIWTVLRRKR